VLQETAASYPTQYAMDVGYDPASGTLAASSGYVLVTGAGSLIDLGFNGLVLGDEGGSGSVTVSQGGSVIAATLNSNENNSLAIGRLGNGTLTVTDPGSQFTAVGEAYIAHSANGTLSVANHATFLASLDPVGLAGLTIGDGSTTGVGGAGAVTVTTDGVFDSQGYVTVGLRGTEGQLTVLNGGTVQVGTELYVGDGGTLSNGTTETGNGTLTVGAGGTVELTGTAQTASYGVYLGYSNVGTASTENALATVSGAGALLNANGNGIAVGEYGTGSLTVSQGGSVVSGIPDSTILAALAIGRQGSGTVTVTDPGSQLTANGLALVGKAGNGSLTVENQGSVVIGLDPLGNGGLNIGGTGPSSTGSIYVGGTGVALVTSGGDLFSQGIKRDDVMGKAEFGQQFLDGRDFVGLLADVEVREQQIGASVERVQHLGGFAILEVIEAALQGLAVQGDDALRGFVADRLQAGGMAAERLLDRVRVKSLKNIANGGMGGRSFPFQAEGVVQAGTVDADEGDDTPERIRSGYDGQDGEQQDVGQLVELAFRPSRVLHRGQQAEKCIERSHGNLRVIRLPRIDSDISAGGNRLSCRWMQIYRYMLHFRLTPAGGKYRALNSPASSRGATHTPEHTNPMVVVGKNRQPIIANTGHSQYGVFFIGSICITY